ncbi:hypothetical protein Q5P01_003271 [Channa striata]|uniref:Uncharacterized protein n=1 Tax=Channa striata TaxID=64152 RepID=A0AA88NM79_CHASR|nr:hypothetical protein Q5P01_003271 [Channa striata]
MADAGDDRADLERSDRLQHMSRPSCSTLHPTSCLQAVLFSTTGAQICTDRPSSRVLRENLCEVSVFPSVPFQKLEGNKATSNIRQLCPLSCFNSLLNGAVFYAASLVNQDTRH